MRSFTMPPACRRLCPSSSCMPSGYLFSQHTLRRRYSITSADTVASDFLAKFQYSDPYTQTQVLDANQLQRFSATLSRPELAKHLPKNGTSLPPGYHLAYFTPSQVERDLGRDGTDTTFTPPSPFTRRMWAGGEIEWVGRANKLRLGQEVTEITRLISAKGKRNRTGEEMIVVGVEKKFQNDHGIALIDKRNWIFRPEIQAPLTPAAKPEPVTFPEGKYVRDFCQTPVTLFRFSALTFNAHKIHYSKEWCQGFEGHRDLVVHGPLNLINLLNFWRDVREEDAMPKKITYRATSPIYAGESYRVIMEDEVANVTEVKIVDSYGRESMVGSIESS